MRVSVRAVAAVSLTLALAGSGAHAPFDIVFARPVSITLSSWLKASYPAQAAARERSTDPRTKRWALLIGINDYASPTVDNVGSRQDAVELRTVLTNLSWRSDHIILLTDRAATRQHILDALHWLELKTTTASTVVFHYAGHEKYTRTTADGDDEARDVELWAADNRVIIDGTLGHEMGRVRSYRMWIDISTCRAAGFTDTGMIKTGRILTFSSTAGEYSYEAAGWHHSVFGHYLIDLGLHSHAGDTNRDGKISIEEVYAWARPYVVAETGGRQHPVIIDRASGSTYLIIR